MTGLASFLSAEIIFFLVRDQNLMVGRRAMTLPDLRGINGEKNQRDKRSNNIDVKLKHQRARCLLFYLFKR